MADGRDTPGALSTYCSLIPSTHIWVGGAEGPLATSAKKRSISKYLSKTGFQKERLTLSRWWESYVRLDDMTGSCPKKKEELNWKRLKE